jgi:hypothetical protein
MAERIMISDDDLLLYFYRDGLDAAERTRIGTALAEQPELAQRLHRLIGRLDAAAAMPEVTVPAQTQQRWRAALEQATSVPEIRQMQPHRGRFTMATWLSAAAVMVLTISVVFHFARNEPAELTAEVTPPGTSQDAGAAQASAYERGLKTHLASTEQQLASLESAQPEERARLVDTIVEQNRIYALAAERAGEPQLARVLRAFTPILEGLRQNDSDPAASVAQLAFELRVMQGRLAGGTASNPISTL